MTKTSEFKRCPKCKRSYDAADRFDDCPHALRPMSEAEEWEFEQRRHQRRLRLMRMQGEVERGAFRWKVVYVIAGLVVLTALLMSI